MAARYSRPQKFIERAFAKSWLHSYPNKPMLLQNKSFENTVGNGEIARNEQFLLFPIVFSTCLENFLLFSSNLKLLSTNSLNLEECKICWFEKVLIEPK